MIVRKKIIFSFILFFFLSVISFSQKAIIQGTVRDAGSGETLVGVNVLADSISGVSTDTDGRFKLVLDPAVYTIKFLYVGYQPEQRPVSLKPGDTLILMVELVQKAIELDMAVVTAGKFEQKLSDVTVSMEIIKPAFIENTNTVNLETAVNQIPGVDVLDGQASIRGGSGYSYGAGSRVLVLVDDLPILTADAGEVKWNYLPVENIEQVEILKGASSALYGSSALNGVINIRTAYPENEPQTTLTFFNGMYMKPEREELAWWWKSNPLFLGASFSDARKLGNLDLVTGANVYSNAGYREENFEERGRANLGLRYRPEKIKGLAYGLNANIQWQHNSDFFIWQDADSGAFLQNPDVITPTKGFRFNVDPWVSYYDKNNNKHSLRTRFYKVKNRFEENSEKDNGSDLYYGEYQFHKAIKDKINLTIGMMGLYGVTDAKLYGDHFNSNIAIYSQLDYKILKKLSTSFGIRWERYTLDNTDKESSPVLRAGMNYQFAEYTFVRASFGQGYRFPSIAEKYTATSLGNLNIFPNPELKPETGWSMEIGLKQGFKIGEWNGFADVAVFRTEYQDMIEFTFGDWSPDSVHTLDDIGFKSLNIGKARITGVDFGITGSGIIGKIPLTLFVGYTYMDPVDLSSDTLENSILKYRYKHSVKGNAEISIKNFSTGASFIYNSFMERIDEAFEEPLIFGYKIFPGLKEYREKNNKGFWVLDFRVSYQFTPSSKLSLILNNLLNKEYMGRPGDIQPPRNVSVQIVSRF
ncbi:MAG: TonB-dependent receptor [Bacteroidales bacterium]|nr:TonB-dependent receptor [Bacteroidales bacterium]